MRVGPCIRDIHFRGRRGWPPRCAVAEDKPRVIWCMVYGKDFRIPSRFPQAILESKLMSP